MQQKRKLGNALVKALMTGEPFESQVVKKVGGYTVLDLRGALIMLTNNDVFNGDPNNRSPLAMQNLLLSFNGGNKLDPMLKEANPFSSSKADFQRFNTPEAALANHKQTSQPAPRMQEDVISVMEKRIDTENAARKAAAEVWRDNPASHTDKGFIEYMRNIGAAYYDPKGTLHVPEPDKQTFRVTLGEARSYASTERDKADQILGSRFDVGYLMRETGSLQSLGNKQLPSQRSF